MKAIILNSGIGKRMGELTKNRPKSLIMLNVWKLSCIGN